MIRSYTSIPVELTPAHILDHLYPTGPARTGRHARAEEFATEAATRAGDLIDPKGVFRMLPAEDLAPWPPTSSGEFLFLALATLGSDLDNACQKHRTTGEDTRALFLDAAGAVAVEAACDVLENAIEEECGARKMKKTNRASPGYGAFPLEDQLRIFEHLPAEDLGVELTAECMMRPLKSVSFVILAGKNPELVRAELTCDACALINCPDRSSSRRCVYREDPS